jgi:hypothetical protein
LEKAEALAASLPQGKGVKVYVQEHPAEDFPRQRPSYQ